MQSETGHHLVIGYKKKKGLSDEESSFLTVHLLEIMAIFKYHIICIQLYTTTLLNLE